MKKKRRVEDDIGRAYPDQNDSWSAKSFRTFSHDDYTVGWICALPLEMAAATAVLDEFHPKLDTQLHDNNAYTLGCVCGHNVVVACLPSGVYGTTSATVTASEMLSSFSSIITWLLVGIGGGVPNQKHDIRLGDVVVSVPTPGCPAVVQYDYGKTVASGKFEQTGNLNKPASSLLTAIAKLRAEHDLRASQIPTIMSKVFAKYPLMDRNYAHPGQNRDVLFQPGCDHVEEGQTCDAACLPDSVARPPRSDVNPRIHYGPIASGNQVMRHSRTRDQIAQQRGILCFEMEAAGLMDKFSCLVIRGICDYCDTQKHKDFQNYAALTAAAYAKELLSTTPTRDTAPMLVLQNADSKPNLEHRRLMMESLDFDQAETRQATIKNAHVKTCKWLLQQSEYQDWLDPRKTLETYGFLWIKGKPGTGKSTIMKFTLVHVERTMSKELISVSFFFNARGRELEKSTTGMYRSLLFQLLKKLPRLQGILDFINLSRMSARWELEVLKQTFRYAVEKLEREHLLCFVDALDECPEDQVRDLIEFFESLSHLAVMNQIRLHVCFSSRHYPHISTSMGLQLVLEEQEGHLNDITTYLSTELKAGSSKKIREIKAQIIEKASGIFLWVVLVVRILNKEYDKGRIHALQKRLKEIPTELNELFKEILMRDGQNTKELLLCIQWILFAQKPLKREEFYFAILSGLDPQSLTAWDKEEITPQDMERFILNSSKGLAEMTRSKAPTVQFIHESVREFMLKKDALVDLAPEFKAISGGPGHHQLKNCCYSYMMIDISEIWDIKSPLPVASTGEAADLRTLASKKFPFLGYAVHYVLYHADVAEGDGVSQNVFIDHFALDLWIKFYNLLSRYQNHRFTREASLLYILAEKDLPNLIKLQRKKCPTTDIEGERHKFPIYTALAYRNRRAVAALLLSDNTLRSGDDMAHLESNLNQELKRLFESDIKKFDSRSGQSAVSYMAEGGSTLIVRLLLDKGVGIDVRNKKEQTPLWLAVSNGHEAVVKLLLDRGAEVDVKDSNGQTPLQQAASNGHEAVVKLLLDKGAEVDVKDWFGQTPLQHAVSNGHEAVVQLLLE